MTREERLVARIRKLEAEMHQERGRLADQRAGAVRELYDLVGATEAARLLSVKRSRIYKLIGREVKT